MGLFNMSADMQQALQPLQMPQPQQARPQSNRIKPSVWGILADALSGAAGQPGQYAAGLRDQQQEQMLLARRQQEQASQYANQREMYDYKLAHPEPANNDTVNDYNFVMQNYGKDAADKWVQNNVIDKPVVVQGPNGPVAYRPSQLGGAGLGPAAPPHVTFTPMPDGGPTAPQSGGFPRSY